MTTATRRRGTSMTRERFERGLFGSLRWVVVAGFIVVTGFPLLYMLALSIKPLQQVLLNPANPFPAVDEITADNYLHLLRSRESGGLGFLTFMGNSLVVTVATVVGVIVLSVLGAYAAARLRFRGRNAINTAIVLVYLLPPILLAVPLFVFFSRVGLRPSLTAVVIAYVAMNLPLALLIIRNYVQSMPADLEEAAQVDGANRLQVLWRITVPLAAPAIASVALYVFISAWDEFLYALLLLVEDRELWTATLAIQTINRQEGSSEALLMTACVLVAVPAVVAFLVAERFLTEGLAAGGLKE